MNRRTLLKLLAAIPIVGPMLPKPVEAAECSRWVYWQVAHSSEGKVTLFRDGEKVSGLKDPHMLMLPGTYHFTYATGSLSHYGYWFRSFG